jgi:hypothetical protein
VLGLIFHYVLTQGLHPFKNDLEIINGEPVLQLKSSPEAVHLISMLLDKEPNTRYQYIKFISNLHKFV